MKKRPCECNKCNRNGPYEKGQCRVCWLYYNNPEYQKKWSVEGFSEKEVVNFKNALIKRIKNEFVNVTPENYEARLKVCENCPSNKNWRCQECGCFITLKAKWGTEDCPQKKWPLAVLEKTKEGKGCGCNKK
jgi:hypothetical protein